MANSFSFSSACIFESDDVTQKSSVGSRTDKGPYFQMHYARLASSCILPAQHINFMYLLHLQNTAELYVGS